MLGSYQNFIQDRFGNGIEGATVVVTDSETNAVSPIFSNKNGSSEKDNPFETGERGFFEFFAAAGEYNLKIEANGVITRFRNIRVFSLAGDEGSFFSGNKEVFILEEFDESENENEAIVFDKQVVDGQVVYKMKVATNGNV